MKRFLFIVPCVLSLLMLALALMYPLRAQTERRYFPETQRWVQGRFLNYWTMHGGLAQQGYPLTAEFPEVNKLDGKTYTVQYFERAIFEHHPENAGTPYEVLLSQLGTFELKNRYPNGAPVGISNRDNPRTFPETGHMVGGKFRVYWESHGELAQQGYPLTEEFSETNKLDGKTYTVQYFERAIFEYHPENAGTPYEVLLSQLGKFELDSRYLNGVTPRASLYSFETDVQAWVHETYTTTQGCVKVASSDNVAFEGQASLMLSMNLAGGDAQRSQGAAYIDLQSNPPGEETPPLDLTDRVITARVYGPPGSVGDPEHPNGFQLFVKDSQFRSKYSSWQNITESEWMTLTLRVDRNLPVGGYMDDEFDPARIIFVGVKMGTGGGSTATYNGPIYVDAVDLPLGAALLDVFPQAHEGQEFSSPDQPGVFTWQFATAMAQRHSADYGIQFTYHVTQTGQYGLWGVHWDKAALGYFDAGAATALTFWVRSEAGGETFQIGLKDIEGHEVKVESETIAAVQAGQWRRVFVPLNKFTGVNTRRINNVNFGFVVNHGPGDIAIDDIAFSSDPIPPFDPPLKEIFPQVGGGATFLFLNQPGSLSRRFADTADCRHSGTYGLRLAYAFPQGPGNGGWGVAWANPPFRAAGFTTLTFWVKAAAGGEAFQVGLGDTDGKEMKIEEHSGVGGQPAIGWEEIAIPLSAFTNVNTERIRTVNFGFNASHGSGSICIDDIMFK